MYRLAFPGIVFLGMSVKNISLLNVVEMFQHPAKDAIIVKKWGKAEGYRIRLLFLCFRI